MIAYKLFRVRKDGSIGPLFINKRQRIPIGEWVKSEQHKTTGYAYRPGWHCTFEPVAPHLSEKGRKWFKVQVDTWKAYERPPNQGGMWILADYIKVLEEVHA